MHLFKSVDPNDVSKQKVSNFVQGGKCLATWKKIDRNSMILQYDTKLPRTSVNENSYFPIHRYVIEEEKYYQ